jgi:hypothetical protein
MPKSTFIHGLWGDGEFHKFEKCFRDIKTTRELPDQPLPCHNYVYGTENHKRLADIGVEATLLGPDGLWDVFGVGDRRSWNPASMPHGRVGKQREKLMDAGFYAWGVSLLYWKFLICQAALQEYDEIVWLDWDEHLEEPLPDDFWDRLRQGPTIQATLRQFCNWQAIWRAGADRRKIPSAAFVYMRGKEVADELVKSYNDPKHHLWREEQVMGEYIERQLGIEEWKGHLYYHEQGFDPYCHWVNGQVYEPEIRLFTAR